MGRQMFYIILEASRSRKFKSWTLKVIKFNFPNLQIKIQIK